jgi:hypothetical protein
MNSSVPLHLQSSGTFGHHIDFIPVKKTSDRVPEMKSSANKDNSEKFFQKDQLNLSGPAATPAFTVLCLICR